MRTLYVVYQLDNGLTDSMTIDIEGKVNEYTVCDIVRANLPYAYVQYEYLRNSINIHIVSWQDTEPFTEQEEEEYWNKQN